MSGHCSKCGQTGGCDCNKPAMTHHPDQAELKAWPFFGYAPGNYTIVCLRCGEHIDDADKRAISCLDCAVKASKTYSRDLQDFIATPSTRSTDNPPAGDVEQALSDPAAVHVNMLRGGIAKPSARNIWHLYGEEALLAEAPEHITAALAAGSGERWRDIESAPKDGTYILLRFGGPFRDTESPGVSVGKITDRGVWLTSIWASTHSHQRPTHWQPLPAPPALNEQEGCQP